MSPKLLKRFYEVLVLLRVLAQVQGDRIDGDGLEDINVDRMSPTEARRKVMYHLCIVCDFLKGGYTVTAMASENLPQGPRYWVAANGHLEKIEVFLIDVLKMLEGQALSISDEVAISRLENELFTKFVGWHKTRIRKYWKLLQTCIDRELKKVGADREADTRADGMSCCCVHI